MANKSEVEAILKLFGAKSSNQAFKTAFTELFPRKKIEAHHMIIMSFSLVVSICLKNNNATFTTFINIVELLNTIVLALFGIVFTGYALFQALVDINMLERMLTVKGGKTAVQISNEYFLNVMLLDIFCIILNTGLLILLKVFPIELLNYGNSGVVLISVILLFCVYFTTQILAIWEMKSFVFNVYQLFNIYAGSKAVEILKKNKNDEQE